MLKQTYVENAETMHRSVKDSDSPTQSPTRFNQIIAMFHKIFPRSTI
jgi:hypothetical protein